MAGSVEGPGRRREGRPVNMFDVAKAAGVSHQTVSRVLNDSAAVKESTRRRVNAAIETRLPPQSRGAGACDPPIKHAGSHLL
ncbi:LacI family DNA-binding transcriptional regulator [Mycobacterium sp. 3519A]|uniref:LacI family DNA-binding transcriptional regulator n=1 Tax=Mycobacterium sp. 3519A TaxID=2057184 RepID=UPI001F273BDE|nr:LacI family DNA-binding transcriptional regulator [Mycobacterium sp. 3519A]